jgi:hypothetical protein
MSRRRAAVDPAGRCRADGRPGPQISGLSGLRAEILRPRRPWAGGKPGAPRVAPRPGRPGRNEGAIRSSHRVAVTVRSQDNSKCNMIVDKCRGGRVRKRGFDLSVGLAGAWERSGSPTDLLYRASCYSFDASTHFPNTGSRATFPTQQHPNASHACACGGGRQRGDTGVRVPIYGEEPEGFQAPAVTPSRPQGDIAS